MRVAVAEEEFELRRQTFADLGRGLDAPETDPSPFRILAIGEPAPQFLALSNALAQKGAEVVGAFTAYTAGLLGQFERYLEREEIDGAQDRISYRQAVLWLTDEELDRYTGQLAAVLEHARDVAALDLADVR